MINTLKVDEIYESVITSLENEAKGVCKINGMVVFVPKALVGEKVRVRITEIKKNFARGKVVEILEPSKKRVTSKCPYYEECGGCSLRHQTKEENLKFKKEKVEKLKYKDYEDYIQTTYQKIEERLDIGNVISNEDYMEMMKTLRNAFKRFVLDGIARSTASIEN